MIKVLSWINVGYGYHQRRGLGKRWMEN